MNLRIATLEFGADYLVSPYLNVAEPPAGGQLSRNLGGETAFAGF